MCAIFIVSFFVFSAPGLSTPLVPELVSPVYGSTVVGPVRIEALVQDSEGAALDVDFHLRPAAPAEAWQPFSVAVLPDTQFYVYQAAGARVDVFEAQTAWVAEQAEGEDMVFATHLGDVIQTWDAEAEWDLADGAMGILDGAIPYGIAVGNHDCDYPRGTDGLHPECIFDQWFPTERYESESWWGGSYTWEGAYSSYQLISASGLDLLFLHLAMEADEDELTWAAEVIDAHPDRLVILSTHWFLSPNGELAGDTPYGAGAVWDSLVEPFDNVWFVLSGHDAGEARRSDEVAGHPVHQILSCYQTIDAQINTDGYLRTMRFEPAVGRVQVETYSPWLDAWMTGDDSAFELDWPVFPYELASLVGVASGGVAQVEWAGLEPGEYTWYVSARDAAGDQASSSLGSFVVEPGEIDTDEPDDSGQDEPDDPDEGCGGCRSAPSVPGAPLALLAVLAAVAVGRRRVSSVISG